MWDQSLLADFIPCHKLECPLRKTGNSVACWESPGEAISRLTEIGREPVCLPAGSEALKSMQLKRGRARTLQCGIKPRAPLPVPTWGPERELARPREGQSLVL